MAPLTVWYEGFILALCKEAVFSAPLRQWKEILISQLMKAVKGASNFRLIQLALREVPRRTLPREQRSVPSPSSPLQDSKDNPDSNSLCFISR